MNKISSPGVKTNENSSVLPIFPKYSSVTRLPGYPLSAMGHCPPQSGQALKSGGAVRKSPSQAPIFLQKSGNPVGGTKKWAGSGAQWEIRPWFAQKSKKKPLSS